MRSYLKCLLLFLLMSLSMSCNRIDDFDVLSFDDTPHSWEKELLSIMNGNQGVLNSSGLELIDYRPLKGIDYSSDDVLCKGTSMIPAYMGDISQFRLMPYGFVQNDTTMMHMRTSYIEQYVDSLCNRNTEYTAVELTWDYDGRTCKSIALFNKLTGELEYDNILTNIVSVKVLEKDTPQRMISLGEHTPASGFVACNSGGEEVQFYAYLPPGRLDGVYKLFASAGCFWYAYGNWINESGQLRFQYTHLSYYRADYGFDINDNTFYDAYNCHLKVVNEYVDMSGGDSIYFTYLIWAGIDDPTVSPPQNGTVQNYVLPYTGKHYITSYCGITKTWTDGYAKTVKIRPTQQNHIIYIK